MTTKKDKIHDAFSTADVMLDKLTDLLSDLKLYGRMGSHEKLNNAIGDARYLKDLLKGLDSSSDGFKEKMEALCDDYEGKWRSSGVTHYV